MLSRCVLLDTRDLAWILEREIQVNMTVFEKVSL